VSGRDVADGRSGAAAEAALDQCTDGWDGMNTQARQYKGLLLDFGSVIQKSFFETRGAIEELLDLEEGAIDWAGPFDPAADSLWRQVVEGQFGERDYWSRRARDVGKLVGEEWTIQDFCMKHNELAAEKVLRPEVLQLIADAKRAGVKFGILTNELELFHGKDWRDKMPFGDQIDCIVDASNTHILKPDPRAYRLALDALGLSADEVIFIDDQPRNVAGGEAVGMRSLHLDITNYQACIDEAREALGL
jgi:putative hydrolase of the HAD superfamily